MISLFAVLIFPFLFFVLGYKLEATGQWLNFYLLSIGPNVICGKKQ